MTEADRGTQSPPQEGGHPGADTQENHFVTYLPFVNTEGLSQESVRQLVSSLQKAYEESRRSSDPTVWQPGSCRRTWDHYFTFKRAFQNFPFRLVGNYRGGEGHLWYEVEVKEEVLVIDPAGYPKSQEVEDSMRKFAEENPMNFGDIITGNLDKHPVYQHRHLYAPYFGLKANAPEFVRRIYENPENETVDEQRVILAERKRFRS